MKDRIWKNHVFRPLMVIIGISVILVVIQQVYVPSDFGVQGESYTYNFYRGGSVEDWKAVTVKYQGREYCKTCHQDKVDLIATTPHAIIQCENCHGPAMQHPKDPPKLAIETTRELCLRCHTQLDYLASGRADIKGIDPSTHNRGIECVSCHNPHSASLGGQR